MSERETMHVAACIEKTTRDVPPIDSTLRGLFFQAQFFSNLNTTTFFQSSPVVGSTVMGNDNALEMHARTIQQLIAANLTPSAM